MELASQILSDITVHMKYARFKPEIQRRETWPELVTRNKQMHIKKYPHMEAMIEEAYEYVYDKKVLPSMRSLQFGGKPIEISPNRIYNCAYLPIDDWRAFGETMFLLLGGSGVGYSVQTHHIDCLPEIRKPNPTKRRRFLIGDAIEGWADTIKVLMKSYFHGGATIDFDFSDIREKGAELVTSGGKAPGPDPLRICVEKIKSILDLKENGDKLTDIEVHDIVCYIADAVLAGGIRRAALICLFSAKSEHMITCKSNIKVTKYDYALVNAGVDTFGETIKSVAEHISLGKKYYDLNVDYEDYYGKFKNVTLYWVSESDIANHLKKNGTLPWYCFHPHRGRANNSALLLRNKITKSFFLSLWKKIEDSKAGEPGIYLSNDKDWGTNPCCEIALRPFQFCNLCEVNVSDITTQEDLNNRVRFAAFIGTLQAGYTHFHYLRPVWQRTTEKEALIGIGMTGIGSGTAQKLDLKQAAAIVKEVNILTAKAIGINAAARTTTIKPSGTSSLVLGTSSGIHAWHNDYYIRRIRVGKNEAIYTYLLINHPELIKDDFFRPTDTAVIEVPQKAPKGSILRTETAIELLERVKWFYENWITPGHIHGQNTHNISATVSLKDTEWEEVGEWMWKNRNSYNGLAVLPYDGGTYIQAPFEDCSKRKYDIAMTHLSSIDLADVIELSDNTNLKDQAACGGGACEIK